MLHRCFSDDKVNVIERSSGMGSDRIVLISLVGKFCVYFEPIKKMTLIGYEFGRSEASIEEGSLEKTKSEEKKGCHRTW